VLGFGQEPDWHPTLDRVVYRGCDTSGEVCGLWTMDAADGGSVVQLTSNPGDAQPRWSPDGTFVIFMSDQRDDNFELYRVDVESGEVARLTNNPAIDGLPSIDPDGIAVAFLSNRDGDWTIYFQMLDGSALFPLLTLPANLPNWQEHGMHWVR
jgi:TolB protein